MNIAGDGVSCYHGQHPLGEMQQGGAGAGGGGVTRQDGVQNMTNYAWAEATHFSTPVKQMEGKTLKSNAKAPHVICSIDITHCGSFTYIDQL